MYSDRDTFQEMSGWYDPNLSTVRWKVFISIMDACCSYVNLVLFSPAHAFNINYLITKIYNVWVNGSEKKKII